MILETGAIFSDCGLYRYHLWRNWSGGDRICWLMLNPSIADAVANDRTVTKCIEFSRRWGYGGLDVINLYAYRSTDPKALQSVADPVGSENDRVLEQTAREAVAVVCAWGVGGGSRATAVVRRLRMLGIPLHHIGLTAKNHPWHPLMAPYSRKLSVWE